MAGSFHIPLATEQQSVAVELQGMLVDLIDLSLIGKQAHWNVEGSHFHTLHAQLDELVDDWRELSDEVAERGDLLVRTAAVLEKQLWMIRAQMVSTEPTTAGLG